MSDNLMPIEEARNIRTERAAAIDLLSSGELKLVSVLRNPPRVLSGLSLWDLLVSCKGLGPRGAKKVFEAAHVWPLQLLRETSVGQRHRIIEHLPPRMR